MKNHDKFDEIALDSDSNDINSQGYLNDLNKLADFGN